MQIEHVALLFRERRALVVAGMIQQSKTVQLRPDHRFRHARLFFLLSGEAARTIPATAKKQTNVIQGTPYQCSVISVSSVVGYVLIEAALIPKL
jgi:hypothetical protein